MFPIAWAVVDQETKHSWSFFINYLIEDLHLGTGHGLTVMSDMQKLFFICLSHEQPEQKRILCQVPTILELLPDCEQRMCARHIWSNWHQTWRGEERRKQFWRCAKSSFEVKFRDEMDKLDIVPTARLVLEENKDLSRNCQVRFNGFAGFGIEDGPYTFMVDIKRKTCTCRTWQLRGIPCQHAVLAYQYLGEEPEDVTHWYRKDTFLKAYQYFLQPIHNMKMWRHTSNIVIEPPEPKPIPGRPKSCRRKAKDEPKKKYEKLSKKGVKMTCSKCHQQGHYRKVCKTMAGMGQPGSSSQPPQHASSSQQSASVCDDTSAVKRVQQAGRGRGRCRGRGVSNQIPSMPGQKRGRGTSTAVAARGQKRPKTVGFGIYTDNISGSQILNPGTTGERVVTPAVLKSASLTNINIVYKPRELR